MKKELIFDMDGTIADLYSVNNLLEKFEAEDDSPYREAKPMYDMDILALILDIFKSMGYCIVIVSWTAMGATKEYETKIEKAKLDWLKRYNFPYDKVHIIKYGTPKQNFITSDFSILVDDDDKVRSSFIESTIGRDKAVIDAKKNIIEQLVNLLVE